MVFTCMLGILAFVSLTEQCCMPKLYEGHQIKFTTLTNQTGHTSLTVTSRSIAYDAVDQRIAINGTVTLGSDPDDPSHHKMIQFFKNNSMYSISNGTCTMSSLPYQFSEDCLPAIAAKTEQCSYGEVTYDFDINGMTSQWTIDDNCFIFKRRNEGITNNYTVKDFVRLKDYTVGVKDTAVFQLPKECLNAKATTSVIGTTDLTHNVFGRHLAFDYVPEISHHHLKLADIK